MDKPHNPSESLMKKRNTGYTTCPYLESPSSSGGHCKISDTYQSGHNYEKYCLSASEWLRCANYEGRVRTQWP